jgi:hypothetical protein
MTFHDVFCIGIATAFAFGGESHRHPIRLDMSVRQPHWVCVRGCNLTTLIKIGLERRNMMK